MKHLALGLSMSAVILAAQSATAPAATISQQPAILDHLVCYKMKDPLTLQTSTDMLAQLQPEFSQQGCILVKPIEFCVPASKRNTVPQPINPNIVGPALSNDYICYQAKCKSPVPPPDKEVIDQFGERLEQGFKVAKVCVPAKKRPPGCGLVGGKACLGACPVDAAGVQQECKAFKTGGVITCDCVTPSPPKPCGGKPDAAGLCTATCPDPTEQCVLTTITDPTTGKVGKATCNCQKPPSVCGIDPATGQCGGKCQKSTDQCVFDSAGKCTCEPAPSPCQTTGNPAPAAPCGGTCPPNTATGTTPTCIPVDGSGICTNGKCVGSNGTPCTSNTDCKVTCTCDPPAGCTRNALTGACGGDCSQNPGTVCSLDSTGHTCDCLPPPCGSVGTATGVACNGTCQNGEKCVADATGACNCQPPTADPCLNSTTCVPSPCLAPQVCSIVPGTTFCRCQCLASSCGTCLPGQTCGSVAGGNCACQ
jgi:hypothetical protein